MSKRRSNRSGFCERTRKRRFRSDLEAQAGLAKARRVLENPPVRAYECQFCGGWHLTGQPFS